MKETKNFSSFFTDNISLIKDYFNTKVEILRLRGIRYFAKSAGYLLWIIISLVLLSLLIIFGGFTTGFWLSQFTGSYAKGFGLTTLLIVALIIILALLRRPLFINPVIRSLAKHADQKTGHEEHTSTEQLS